MEINFLKKMEATPTIRGLSNKGMSETEILVLEKNAGVNFPKAYKEFLFLGGKMFNMLGWEGVDWQLPDIQKATRDKVLGNSGFEVRPFWNFADSDHADVFLFFYLDEGEDPAVYYTEFPYDEKRKDYDHFSDCIDAAVDHRLSETT